MKLQFQQSALDELKKFASSDKHSVLIEGLVGSGKTYLAKQYASMLDIHDFVTVASTVNDIRSTIDTAIDHQERVVICIENLDQGVLAASYVLLKFLEEPKSNVYIVVTCTNINKVPDTIVSRSSIVTLASPRENDLEAFSISYDERRRSVLRGRDDIWKSIKTLQDVDYCMNLTAEQCDYLEDIPDMIVSKKSISDIVWAMNHYSDNTEIPPKFVLRYLISNMSDTSIRNHAVEAVRDLDSSRIAAYAVLSKFIMECKYGY